MKITHLDLVDADSTTTLPVVHQGQSGRATLGQMVDASFGPLASALAVALGNYRATYAQALADLAVGQMFACDASGEMRLYRRITAAPGYQYYDDVLTGGLARARTVSIDLAANIAARRLDASVAAIITGGHSVAGIGGGTYVADDLATADLAAAYPALCKQSGDGRYWRLAIQHGAMAIEQAGALPADASKATANVAAARAALAYLAALGGGMLTSGAGLYYFAAAALGATGLAIPNDITISAPKGAIWAVSGDQAACQLLTNTGTRTVWVEGGLELRGRVTFAGLTGGGIRPGVAVTGKLSSPVQYAETTINVAAAFASGLSYNDGKGNVPAADYTCTVSGSTVTMQLSNSGALLGSARYQRNVQSDYIPLDPTARYVVAILDGLLSGAGGNKPVITLYDASHNPIDAGMGTYPYAGAPTPNVHVPNGENQNGYRTAMIYGASYMKVQVGAYRGYGTSVGLSAVWDVSKIVLYKVVNDLAAQDMMTSPGDSGQVILNNCANVVIDGVRFSMINRSAVKLTGCTNTHVRRCMGLYVLQGATDDNGVGNCVSDNVFDLRLLTSGGALINSRAFRLRGIGGSNMDRGHYCRNIVKGASWGIEILAYHAGYSNVVSDNTVWAEYAGLSLAAGTWQVDSNRIYVGPAALFGIESPGTSTDANTMRGEGNVIAWSSFSGYVGFGVSASTVAVCALKGGSIKAPWIFQSVGSNASSCRVELTGVDGEFSAGAALIRDKASVRAHFGRLAASPVLSSPYAEGASTATFDSNVSDTGATISLGATSLVMGADELVEEAGSADVRLNFPETMANSAGYMTDYYLKLNWLPATAKKVHFTNCRFINFPSAMTLNRWAAVNGTAYTGSSIYQHGCAVSGQRAYVPGGTYSPGIVRGDQMVVAYLVNQAFPTLAAGASVTFTGQPLIGLPASGGSGVSVSTFTGGGLNGLVVSNFQPTADNTYSITFTNISGGSLSPPTQSIRVQLISSSS